MSESHPSVVAARAAEAAINEQIQDELDSATHGAEVELNLTSSRATALESQIADARSRLDHLAGIRAEYANIVAEVHLRTDTLKTAETQLAEARASQAAAHTASLLSRIDTPDTGATPIGPGGSMIVVGGATGGLIVGLGLLFLTVPPLVSQTDSETVHQVRGEEFRAAVGAGSHERFAKEFAAANVAGGDRASANRANDNASDGEYGSSSLSFKQALTKLQSTPQGTH